MTTPANDPKPRRSAWRWWTALAAGLVLAAGVFLIPMELRARQRAEFERRMVPLGVYVGYYWSPPLDTWLDDAEMETDWFDRRLGKAHVGFGTDDFPGSIQTPEQLQQALASLNLVKPVSAITLNGSLVDDAALESIPPGITFEVVTLHNCRVTEAGLRNCLQRHRPSYVTTSGDNLSEESIHRLKAEFPEITMDLNSLLILIPD